MEAYVAPPVRVPTAGAAPAGVARHDRAARVGGQWPRRRWPPAAAARRRGRPAAAGRRVAAASAAGDAPSLAVGGPGAAAVAAAPAVAAALDAPCDTQVLLYDTTLRDGTQQEGISLSVMDKLRVVEKLDHFGVDYIEGRGRRRWCLEWPPPVVGERRGAGGGRSLGAAGLVGVAFAPVALVRRGAAALGAGRLGQGHGGPCFSC